ncbi:MAG TPA: DUF362 domain-containing protein [Patescibacteria group bacterium]|nr:DUF362 domain-containing protein [Patescibacteria group bacterium]
MKPRVSLVECRSYEPDLVVHALRSAVDLLGGLAAFIKPASRVLVKPNLLSAADPASAVDTHPQVVRAAVKLLKEMDCRVFIGDGPSLFGNQEVDRVYERSGIKEVAAREKVELVTFTGRRWQGQFPLVSFLDECDHVLSLPKFKTHQLVTLTGGIKNMYGLVAGTFKTELHRKHFDAVNFSRVLVDIYAAVRPSLTIVDGILAMEGDGPGSSGTPRPAGVVLAGSDCVAIDSVMAKIMGLEPLDILTTKEAALRGLGTADPDAIEICGRQIKDVFGGPFRLPKASVIVRLPRPLVPAVQRLIRFYPQIDHAVCTRCAACVKVCPAKVISIRQARTRIDRRGCISCFCCQETCPSSAIRIKKSLCAKVIGL